MGLQEKYVRFSNEVEITNLKQSQNEKLLDRLTKEKLHLTELLLKNDSHNMTQMGFDPDLEEDFHFRTKTTTQSDEAIFKKVDKIMEITFDKKEEIKIQDSFIFHENSIKENRQMFKQIEEFPNTLGNYKKESNVQPGVRIMDHFWIMKL